MILPIGLWGSNPKGMFDMSDNNLLPDEKMLSSTHGPIPTRARSLNPTPPRDRLLVDTSEARKNFPICSGLFDYFPDACAAVAEVSKKGNDKHNPGQPLHWARGKSMDHADCIARHLIERGGFDGGIRHSAALAWRAMALLQEELEAEFGLASPRGAKEA